MTISFGGVIMDKERMVFDVICNVLSALKRKRIPEAAEMNISLEEYVSIIEAMIRKELIREVFVIKENDGTKSVLMTNAEITFHGEVFLSQECGGSVK
jgi:hypothetical protein